MDDLHERFDRDDGELASDRSFGAAFAAFFALVVGLPMASGQEPRWWAPALAFLAAAVSHPRVPHPACFRRR